MYAYVVTTEGRLELTQLAQPVPSPMEALVRVRAISLNRGEVTRLQGARPGTRPGWDVAGIVEQAAADGSGPAVGARVVGVVAARGWAEQVAVPASALAIIPDGVDDATAACLPVAGLTACHALRRGGALLGRRVLVTGASGGVGQFACRLAHLAGAQVTGVVRRAADADMIRQTGADAVAVLEQDANAARAFAPYDLIIESVGGSSLVQSLDMLAPRGTCVVFGVSADSAATLDARAFYMAGSKTISGLAVFEEIRSGEPAGHTLSMLLRLLESGRLKPPPAEQRPFTALPQAAEDLLTRRVNGKIVLLHTPSSIKQK